MRLFLDQPVEAGSSITLEGDRAHYVTRVLRKGVGAELWVFCDSAYDYSANIVSVANRRVELRIGDARETNAESSLSVGLFQGLARGERMDFVVQKATELGVARITPVFTDFSVVKLDASRAARRRAHWEKVAQSACEQCGRSRVPEIALPCALSDVLQERTAHPRLVLAPDGEQRLAKIEPPADRLDILVGPEGGLSATELDAALSAGFRSVALGPRILRTETAALSALAALQTLWGDF